MKVLAENGIPVGTTLMPVLPFLEDNPENILDIVEQTAAHGGTFILPWFGMSLRDRQREHYYAQLDRLFPGLRAKYERRFGNRYGCQANNANQLAEVFHARRAALGLADCMPGYLPPSAPQQLSLDF